MPSQITFIAIANQGNNIIKLQKLLQALSIDVAVTHTCNIYYHNNFNRNSSLFSSKWEINKWYCLVAESSISYHTMCCLNSSQIHCYYNSNSIGYNARHVFIKIEVLLFLYFARKWQIKASSTTHIIKSVAILIKTVGKNHTPGLQNYTYSFPSIMEMQFVLAKEFFLWYSLFHLRCFDHASKKSFFFPR